MKNFVIILFLLSSIVLYAQKENNKWYFGRNAGIDFNDPLGPVPLSDGIISATEGSASVADAEGNLLFYTDGRIVVNRNHQVMPNGSDLKGNASTSQAAVIVQKPGCKKIYYVFALAAGGGTDGLTYSEVDMSLENGLGNVTANKNVQLVTPANEKLTTARHADGESIWVITHRNLSTDFYAYLVTTAGVNLTPVMSRVGSLIGASPGSTFGCMKVSPAPECNYLVSANSYLNTELFRFNNSTGEISDPVILNVHNPANVDSSTYGVEFSPSGNLVYVARRLFNEPVDIHQYDLRASDIPASEYSIAVAPNRSMELGPDGKIYIVRTSSTFLSVINDPDSLGDKCNYDEFGFSLATGTSVTWGISQHVDLPNFSLNSYCSDREITFGDNYNLVHDSLRWDFGDPVSGNLNTSTLTNPVHIYDNEGVYIVNLFVYNSGSIDTVTQQITISVSPTRTDTLTICEGDSVLINGAFQSNEGIYDNIVPAGVGECCDSVIKTQLLFESSNNSNFGYNQEVYCLTDENPIPSIFVQGNGSFSINNNGFIDALSGEVDLLSSGVGVYRIAYDINIDCPSVVTLIIDSCLASSFEFPNVFTPNNDNQNDVFKVQGTRIGQIEMKIYNRWGLLIFESDQFDNWDGKILGGKDAPEGTYFYVASVSLGEKKETSRGSLTLLR